MRRRTTLTTGLAGLALLPASVLAGPVPVATAADGACTVSDGTAIVVAPSGTTSLVVGAGDAINAFANGSPFCSLDRANVIGLQMGDADGAVQFWSLNRAGSFPGVVDIASSADDTVALSGADGPLDVTAGARGVLRMDAGRWTTRIRVPQVPETLELDLFAGGHTIDLTTGTGWAGDVTIESLSDGLPGGDGGSFVRLGAGDDEVQLLDGADEVSAGAGSDEVDTRGGGDRVVLGGGNDVAWPGAGRDRVAGGIGADQVFGADGTRDVLDGGPGRDGASWDRVDVRRSIAYRLG